MVYCWASSLSFCLRVCDSNIFFALSLMILRIIFRSCLIVWYLFRWSIYLLFPFLCTLLWLIPPANPVASSQSSFCVVILFRVAWYMVFVLGSTSVKASFSMLSGPVLFSSWVSLLQCSVLLWPSLLLMVFVASVFLFLWLCFLFHLSIVGILVSILMLGIAAHNIVLCIFLASSGFVSFIPSSVMVSYGSGSL